jgi:hypothetical protein
MQYADLQQAQDEQLDALADAFAKGGTESPAVKRIQRKEAEAAVREQQRKDFEAAVDARLDETVAETENQHGQGREE